MALFDPNPLNRAVRGHALGETDPTVQSSDQDLFQNAARRGTEQSLGLGADYAGLLAENLDKPELAQDLYGYADKQMVKAGRMQRGPQTLGDIQGLDSAVRYGVNKFGESAPVSALAAGTAMATGGTSIPAQLAASSAATFPVLAGETSYSMRQDQDSTATIGERAAAATGAGAIGSVLEVLPETGVLRKLMGAGRGSPAKNMADAVVKGTGVATGAIAGEAVTEVGQTAVSRGAQSLFNPNIAVDPRDPEARAEYLESAAAGAAGGAGFGIPAGVATTAMSSVGVAADALNTAPTMRPNTEGLRQSIGNLLTPRSPAADPNASIEDLAADELVQEQTISERMAELGRQLQARTDLTNEERAVLDQETDLDPDAQEAVQNLYEKKNREDAAQAGINRLQPEGTASRMNPTVPLEEIDAVVSSAAVENEAQSPVVRNWIASTRQFFGEGGQLTAPMINDALNIFGERGYSVLRAVAPDNTQVQELVDQDQRENGNFNNFMLQALKPEYRDNITPAQLRQLRGMILDAANEGVGDVSEILSTAFSNPQEVLDALSANTVPDGTQEADLTQAAVDSDTAFEAGSEAEFGETQSVQDVSTQLFGDTTGNRRIKTGGLNIPYPVDSANIELTKNITRNVERLAPESDLAAVPAFFELQRLGVDPADVAAEMGVSTDALRSMFFIKGTAQNNESGVRKFVTELKKRTIEQLNNDRNDPSNGSYLGFVDDKGAVAALDLRLYVGSKVFGKRTPNALMEAMAEGVTDMLVDGYTLADGLPGSLVLARYDRSGQETTITIDGARSKLSEAQRQNTGEAFPFKAEDFGVLNTLGIEPRVDYTTGELYLSEQDVTQIVEKYVAALASRNAAARGTAIPTWTQALIDKHGTNVPSELGRASVRGSLMFDMVQWALNAGIDSRALAAIAPNRVRAGDDALADSQQARVQAQRDREGPAAIGGDSEDRTAQVAQAFGVQELDPDTMPAQLLKEVGVATERGDEPTKISKRRSAAQQAAADRLEGRDPTRPRRSFIETMSRAEQLVRNMQWAVGELPTGVDLKGKYAVLGKIAARGEPLQFATAKAQTGVTKNVKIEDANKLVEAYNRRGFRMRKAVPMNTDVEGNIYSDAVTSRLLGANADAPVHLVLTIGDTPSSRLATRLGIPVLDLSVPAQQKIAGDILRSYDRGRRQQVQNSSTMSAEMKKAMLKGEERQGIERVRDVVNAQIAKRMDAGMFTTTDMQSLQTLADIVMKADNDFFSAAIEGRSLNTLLDNIDNLNSTFDAYQKEQGKASRVDPGDQITADDDAFVDAIEYIRNVLPDDVRVEISELPGMSGFYSQTTETDTDGNEFVDRVIELSVYTADPMSVAFHESMHALLKTMGRQREQAPFIKALTKAANSPLVLSQLRAKLQGHPAALEQVNKDSEERIAYMYQFWAAGELNLASSVENWFAKFTQMLRQVFGIPSNVDKAGLYMAAFRDGRLKQPSAVNEVVMASLSGPERALRAAPVVQKIYKIAEKVVRTSHGRLKSYGNPALDKIADTFYNDSSSGYLQTVRSVVTMYGSQFGQIMQGVDPADISTLASALHSQKAPTDAALRGRYNQINQLLRRLHAYSKSSGLNVGRVQDYFPQAWDKTTIEDNRDGFIDMLVNNAKFRDDNGRLQSFDRAGAEATADMLLYGEEKLDIQEDLAGYSPFMEASMGRQIVLDDRALAAEFMDHDIVRVLTRYITQAAKRGEYTRHFGPEGENLKEWLDEAMATGVTPEEVRGDINTAIMAMEGTLGHDINPVARNVMSGLVTWQNLAVLPLAIFSSLIDPMGIVVRGGTVEQAWTGFKAGVKNIPQSIRKNGTKSDMQQFAELVGTVESQMTMDMLGDMYGSAFMSDWARKTNNMLFRYNLMEGWNTAIRSAATVAAVDFIERHAQNIDPKNSKRWLSELGITGDNVVFTEEGKLLWSQRDITEHMINTGGDISTALEKSRFAREAINRWVDGAVLRPHAAHRPAWGSDPRWMLIWHLKQFTYSFQKTILERVMHESKNGNYAPLMAIAAYVPFMIAADYLRGMVQGLGEEPDWKKDMSFGETVWHGTQRAGLLGVRQLGMDGAENPMFALGPTAGYMWKAGEKVLDGEVTDAVVAGLPGNVVWKGW